MNNYKILVVDDVPLNQMLVERMLGRFNFNIRKAGNGYEALQSIKEEKPDLILLDIMMPVMDGFEVLKELKRSPETKDIKVIVLSALNTNSDIIKGYELGAKDFITKPIMLDKLVNSVGTQIEAIKKERENVTKAKV